MTAVARRSTGAARERIARATSDRRRRALLESARPPGADEEAHTLRVELALARGRALHELHWTPDVVSRADLEAVLSLAPVVDPGIGFVRLGGPGDGGYVVPDDLDDLVACLSPGVADRADFELAMLDRGVPCHLMDASVEGPPVEHPLLRFRPQFLGGIARPGWTTLPDWVATDCPAEGDLVLQMDIEGHEWPVLATTPTPVLERFRLLVLEVHDLHLMATRSGLTRVEEVWRRLSEHFALVDVHANNYEFPVAYRGLELHPVVETTWLRRDRLVTPSPARGPHELDQPNSPDLPDFSLDPAWGRPPDRDPGLAGPDA